MMRQRQQEHTPGKSQKNTEKRDIRRKLFSFYRISQHK